MITAKGNNKKSECAVKKSTRGLDILDLSKFFTTEIAYNPDKKDKKIAFANENSKLKTLVSGKLIKSRLNIKTKNKYTAR